MGESMDVVVVVVVLLSIQRIMATLWIVLVVDFVILLIGIAHDMTS